jgi:hypothetical protein
MRRATLLIGLLALGIVCPGGEKARAAESAAGIYLLGAKGSMAGYVPPPGTYFTDYSYFYSGDATGQAALGVTLRRTGNLNLQTNIKVEGTVALEAPTFIWVAPQKVLGGNLGLGAIIPVGWKKVDVNLDALATLTLPPPLNITLTKGRHFDFEEDTLAFGDPLPTALLGWHNGNWNWNIQALVNVPIGEWERTSISNLGFNRWALDITPAVTWFDAKSGAEISAAAGFTYNWENPDSNYKTGTEFHVEFALMQHFSKQFAAGLVGYHYQQVTGDSGAGAALGGFEGRVTGLGPDVSYTLLCGKIPISTELKFFHEFDVENRVEGNAGMFTVSMPLSVDH